MKRFYYRALLKGCLLFPINFIKGGFKFGLIPLKMAWAGLKNKKWNIVK